MDLDNRLSKIEKRLAFIEKFLGDNFVVKNKRETTAVTPMSSVAPAPTTVTPAAAPTTEAKPVNSFQVPNYTPPDPAEKASIHFIDNNAFNRRMMYSSTNNLFLPIAILGFLLVSFFTIRFALDTGWLTPIKQIFISALLSILFIGAGFFYKDLYNEYIRYLPGLGIIILFLVAYASTNYYHFFPKNAALLFIGTVGISCLMMYQEFKHAIYLIIGAAGAYIIPLYVANESNLTLTNSYFLFISAVFAGMAYWLNLRPIYLLCAYLALPISSIAEYHGTVIPKIVFIMAHFIIFSGGMFVHSVRYKQQFSKQELIAFAPIVLLFYVIEYYNFEQIQSYVGPVFILAATSYLGAMYMKMKKMEQEEEKKEEEVQVVQA